MNYNPLQPKCFSLYARTDLIDLEDDGRDAECVAMTNESAAFDAAVTKLRSVASLLSSEIDLKRIVEAKEEVLCRFQPIFKPDYIPELTEQDFSPLLYFEYNHHWSGLHRHLPKIRANMPKLRETLAELLDESKPIDRRFNDAIGSVPGMGKAIVTAILQIVFPDKYGVWNNTSEGGLRILKIWPKFEHGESSGSKYAKINEVLKELSRELKMDLWTLDSLWWAIKSEIIADSPAVLPYDNCFYPSRGFRLERQLQDFLADNWESISLSKEWLIYSEDDDDDAGVEYPCDAGFIDILARHRNGKDWLVVELKRNQANDDTIGQVLRYMGWIKAMKAKPDQNVRGLIIARDANQKLQYALNAVKDVAL